MGNGYTREDFFSLLFRENEYTCLASQPKGTSIFSYLEVIDDTHNYLFYSLNPIDGYRDHEPVEEWHHPNKPRRADCNCTRISNILVEFDGDGLGKQYEALLNSGLLDLTAGVIYSGSKSLHAVFALADVEFKSKERYSEFVDHFYHAVLSVTGIKPDFSTKNPSRLTRCPNSYREKNDHYKKQQLIYVGKRIFFDELSNWLKSNGFSPFPPHKTTETSSLNVNSSQKVMDLELRDRTVFFLTRGVPKGFVHNERYAAVCDMASAGMSFEDILQCFENFDRSPPNRNAYKTMEDAYNTAIRTKKDYSLKEYDDIKIGQTRIITDKNN